MNPRQFPIHSTVSAVGAAAILSLFGSDFFTPAASGAGPNSIEWRSEYNSAYFEAKTAKRLLWIQFTGPWCPSCKRMERDSFPQAQIVEHTKKSLVPVKLRSDENEDLAMKFNLTGLPATVVVDPDTQTVLTLHQGYLGPDELNDVFGQAAALRENHRTATDTQLASATKSTQDRLYTAIRATYSRLQQQGLQADFRISNLPAALIASAMKAGVMPLFVDSGPKKNRAEVALAGYCPVSLVCSRRLVLGETAYSIHHEGKVYRFANEAMSRRFRQNPDRYVPVNQGRCPVAGVDRQESVAGDPHFGVLYGERLYLCASSEDRRRFLQDPAPYAVAYIEEKGYCPHCTRQDGLLVQGDPHFGLIRSGKEYWFPDDSHRSAFLASLPADKSTTRR